MASIQKTSKGYRAQIKLSLSGVPVRDSSVFPTKREAVEWAARREAELRTDATTPIGDKHTLKAALRRYADEVSPTKRGERWEQIRLSAFESYKLPIEKPIGRITSQDIADFRDARAAKIGPGSVRRELSLLSSVFETARLEWGWADLNPCKAIRKPPHSKHRERVIQWGEIKRMLRQMGHRRGRPSSVGQSVAVCMLLALRTGMRAGELTGMQWGQVFEKHIHLPLTKSGRSRNVPLSSKARSLLRRMNGWDDESVFGLQAPTLDALFRKYRGRAGLEGFTWHDTRHTAATMISKRIPVLDLCKMFGWTDPKMAMVYYNPHASSIADMLG